MPLDVFQFAVLKSLKSLRSPKSFFAGGSVLHRHGFRLSGDQDIFHASGEDVASIAKKDIAVLVRDGFQVTFGELYKGLVNAVVSREGEGSTKIQWVEAGTWNFFQPVPDAEFGWRLHIADLAVNKVLAAGGRRAPRDYVDLLLIHQYIMPLWHAIWAAPGKDESWSPASLAEKIAMTNNFRQIEIDEEVVSTIGISASEVGQTIRAAVEEARAIFDKLPDHAAGRLFVDADGRIVQDLSKILSLQGDIRSIDASRTGTWPSSTSIDHALIDRIVSGFGEDGETLSVSLKH
jgi:hypothetical protein